MPSKLHWIAGMGIALFSTGLVAQPTTDGTSMVLSIERTVRTMLDLDAELALRNEHERFTSVTEGKNTTSVDVSPSPESGVAPAAQPTPTEAITHQVNPVLLGIFGIGDTLFADVEIDNQRVRFQKGQSQALGVSHEFPFRLVRIDIPCVTIRDQTGTYKTCLAGRG